MDNLVQEEIADTTEEESDMDEEFDISLPSPKIKSYREVMKSTKVQTLGAPMHLHNAYCP